MAVALCGVSYGAFQGYKLQEETVRQLHSISSVAEYHCEELLALRTAYPSLVNYIDKVVATREFRVYDLVELRRVSKNLAIGDLRVARNAATTAACQKLFNYPR